MKISISLKPFCILLSKIMKFRPCNLELERTKFGSIFWDAVNTHKF